MNNYPMNNMPYTPNMSHKPHMPCHSVVVHPVDHCVVETLRSVVGSHILLETTRGAISGCVVDVKPDHVVIETRNRKFFIRIAEIVWIMPE